MDQRGMEGSVTDRPWGYSVGKIMSEGIWKSVDKAIRGLRRKGMTEDEAQDLRLKVCVALDRGLIADEEGVHMFTYACRVGLNILADRNRRAKKLVASEWVGATVDNTTDELDAVWEGLAGDGEMEIEDNVLVQDWLRRIQKSLVGYPGGDMLWVILSGRLRGESWGVIAGELGVGINTCKSKWYRWALCYSEIAGIESEVVLDKRRKRETARRRVEELKRRVEQTRAQSLEGTASSLEGAVRRRAQRAEESGT